MQFVSARRFHSCELDLDILYVKMHLVYDYPTNIVESVLSSKETIR